MISTKGRYALRMMVDLAQQGPEARSTLRSVSERQGISIKYLEQLASSLVGAGLVKSVRGPRGGYLLARCPDQITAGDVLRAAEGTMAPVACLAEGAGCDRRDTCTTLRFWNGLQKATDSYVDGVTLAELAFADVGALNAEPSDVPGCPDVPCAKADLADAPST